MSSTEVTLCSNSDTTSSSTFSSDSASPSFALVVVGGGKVEAEEEEGEETKLIACVPLSLSLSLSVVSNEKFCPFLLLAFFLKTLNTPFLWGFSFSWRYEVTYYRNRLLALSSLRRSFEEREKDYCVYTCY